MQSNALLTRERDLIKAKLDSMRKSELAKEDLRAAAEALSKTHIAQLVRARMHATAEVLAHHSPMFWGDCGAGDPPGRV